MSTNLCTYFSEHGILHQSTCVDTPQKNRVAKWKNLHLLEVTRSSMLDMHGLKSYWGDALLTAEYSTNRKPSCVFTFKASLEVLSPPLSTSKGIFLKVFKCVCFDHIHVRGKLDPRTLKCIFVGYSPSHKGYKCYYLPSRNRFVSMDVTFCESHLYFSCTQISLQRESPGEENFFE
jgi:hypothetical protein